VIVSGEGYFAAYTRLMLPLGVEAKSSGYGSGRIYAEQQTLAQNENQSSQDDNCTCTDNDFLYNNTFYGSIWTKYDKRMVYAPVSMEIGRDYFASHPPAFRLPLTDETWMINSDDGNSIQHEVTYSHALVGELEASIEDYQSENDDQAFSTMKVVENVTAGITHLGIVQLDIDDGDDDAVDDDDDDDGDLVFQMDETYSGNFQTALNTTLPDDDVADDNDDDDDYEQYSYLPCCSGQSQNAASQDDSGCSQGGPLSDDNVIQELDRTVRGVGYFTADRYLATPYDLEIKGSDHWSGAIEGEWQFTGQSDNDNCSLIACLNNNSPDFVQRDQNQMDFSPVTMAVGEGFYADHPVTCKSLLVDETSIKDNTNANSMSHKVEYAHGLFKELGITVYDIDNDDQDMGECGSCCSGCMNGSTHICSGCSQEGNNQGCNTTFEPDESDEVTTIMNLSERVTDGKARTAFSLIGSCAGNEDGGESETAGICPAMRMDEDYVGTFSIAQNMTLIIPDADDADDVEETWLPRCNCGYWDANLHNYGMWRQDCIFNCTGR
jgi:hypothetical protein